MSNFFAFCQLNQDYRIECSAKGELMIMPPTGSETGNRILEGFILTMAKIW